MSHYWLKPVVSDGSEDVNNWTEPVRYDGAMSEKAPPASRVLAEQLRVDIAAGRWKPGDKIPSERQLAETHKIARNTAREAIRSLTHEGLLAPRHGSGVYVTAKPKLINDGELDDVEWDSPPLIALSKPDEITLHVSSSHLAHRYGKGFALDGFELQASESGTYVAIDEIADANDTIIATITSAARYDDIDDYEYLVEGSTTLDLETELFNSWHEVGNSTVRIRTSSSGAAQRDSDERFRASPTLVINTMTFDRNENLILLTRLAADGNFVSLQINPTSRRTIPITAERLIRPLVPHH